MEYSHALAVASVGPVSSTVGERTRADPCKVSIASTGPAWRCADQGVGRPTTLSLAGGEVMACIAYQMR